MGWTVTFPLGKKYRSNFLPSSSPPECIQRWITDGVIQHPRQWKRRCRGRAELHSLLQRTHCATSASPIDFCLVQECRSIRARGTSHFPISASNPGLEEATWCSELGQTASLRLRSARKRGVGQGFGIPSAAYLLLPSWFNPAWLLFLNLSVFTIQHEIT